MSLRDTAVLLEDGTVLNARVHLGVGAPLVLLHDLDCSARYWDAVVGRLLELKPDLPVVALDLRGHGASTCSGETSRKRLVSDLKRTCKALGLDDPVVCGHGWGADVALAAPFAGSVIAINPLLGREPAAFVEDAPRPQGMVGANSPAVLESCRIGATTAKRLRRTRRDAPLLLVAADPGDTGVEGFDEIADAASEAFVWQDATRHLPLEAPHGVAALLLSWIEEMA